LFSDLFRSGQRRTDFEENPTLIIIVLVGIKPSRQTGSFAKIAPRAIF